MKWWKDEMDTQMRVGPYLRKLRLDYKLTQQTIAEFIGCHHTTICALELGKVGSLKLVEAYAWALGLELSDLEVGKPGVTFMNSAKRKREKAAAKTAKVRRPARYAVRRVA